MTALFQELQRAIPIDRLEMDRVHRALTPNKSDGPPHNIIAKFNFYRTKEQLLSAARNKETINFQGHNYQLFADLSQLTINKRRSLKPVLQRNQIAYQWGFPFSVRFAFQGCKFTCRSANSKLPFKTCICWTQHRMKKPLDKDQHHLLQINPLRCQGEMSTRAHIKGADIDRLIKPLVTLLTEGYYILIFLSLLDG